MTAFCLRLPRDYFSEDQSAPAFVPAFIEEGMINGRLAVLPVARSTEIMYINKTLFDRFASDTGTTVESLGTLGRPFRQAAERYARRYSGRPDAGNCGRCKSPVGS